MSKRTLLFVLLCAFGAQAQRSWKAGWSLPLTPDNTWDVDQAGNVYLFDNQSISKLDPTGKKLLTQSAKSLGTIKKIDATNWLKIAVFSEEQQQICYLDNALAIQNECIELVDKGVTLAQNFATSGQTDRVWIYDQLNSELQLITLRSNQRQIVQNLRSLVDLGNVTQLFEFQNILYIADDRGQITTFDNFGTFINSITIESSCVQPFDKGLLYSRGYSIAATTTDETEQATFFILPEQTEPIRRFFFVNKRLYVSTDTRFLCFDLIGK